ncbi:MAG: RIP metalloprotease RseP [Candidatus Moranbacteria bacterium]|nr:RIP metalloprotease RseP [Candidatus Moranbacteria bacterium]
MTFMTFLIFFLLLGVLILAHELGHFIVAIRNGIKAEEFGFGFPPRLLGIVKDSKTGERRIFFGDEDVKSEHTIFSLNWIPFGGFVRMKGEDSNALLDPDSFASKSVGIRVAVLAAGVAMNFILAWVLISSLYAVGFPQPVTDGNRHLATDVAVQIFSVAKGSPAEVMGLIPGDRILAVEGMPVFGLSEAKRAIDARLGNDTSVTIGRGGETLALRGTPRQDAPANEGALGISFAETGSIRYPWYEAPIRGAQATWNATTSILIALVGMVRGLFLGHGAGIDVTGPVGIVYATKQMSELGIAYLIQFAAILSINLAIFNILPLPALDGGRILFVIIEKFKGTPVREAIEQRFHQVGFFLLLLLMVVVTVRDFSQFRILEKIGNLFS